MIGAAAGTAWTTWAGAGATAIGAAATGAAATGQVTAIAALPVALPDVTLTTAFPCVREGSVRTADAVPPLDTPVVEI
jgi:hypothetical protein